MLTPEQVKQAQFRRCLLGGYDRQDVEVFVAKVSDSLETCLLRIAELEARIQEANLELQRHLENESALRKTTLMAQRSADDLIADAQRHADTILADAAEQAAKETQLLALSRQEAAALLHQMAGLAQEVLNKISIAVPLPALASKLEQGDSDPVAGNSVSLQVLSIDSNYEQDAKQLLILDPHGDEPAQLSSPAESSESTTPDSDAEAFAAALTEAVGNKHQSSKTRPSRL